MKLTASHRLSGFMFLFLILCPGLAHAYESLVEKKVFTIPSFTTVSGDVIKDVRFGYETYGHLDASKSNAILVLPYFSGTGHAAGKFADTDQAPGYWDSIIGSGKPLNTERYFIIAGDG
jgi:homoserine O-acetyltransferase